MYHVLIKDSDEVIPSENLKHKVDLAISIKSSNEEFTILKNRYGGCGKELPLSILPEVLKNPAGEVRATYSWLTKV